MVLLPDITPFIPWYDQTDYRHMDHVDCQHPTALDDNPITEGKPFATFIPGRKS
jgi:hypothetical protein